MSANVLIASGDSKRLLRLKRLVEQQGAIALLAEDARATMHQFVRRGPELTLLNLDDEIGLELCKDMKSLRAGRQSAIMVVGPQFRRSEAFAAGCHAFIQRSSDLSALSRAVRGFLTVTRRKPAPSSVELLA